MKTILYITNGYAVIFRKEAPLFQPDLLGFLHFIFVNARLARLLLKDLKAYVLLLL